MSVVNKPSKKYKEVHRELSKEEMDIYILHSLQLIQTHTTKINSNLSAITWIVVIQFIAAIAVAMFAVEFDSFSG